MLFGWLILFAVVIAFVVWGASAGGRFSPGAGRRSSGLDILEERYAKGEIQREEYLEKKRDLNG